MFLIDNTPLPSNEDAGQPSDPPQARRTLFAPPNAMPPTQWARGLPPKRGLPPLHAPIVRRLTRDLGAKELPIQLRRPGQPKPSTAYHRGTFEAAPKPRTAPPTRLRDVPDEEWESSISAQLRGGLRASLSTNHHENLQVCSRLRAQNQKYRWDVREQDLSQHVDRIKAGHEGNQITERGLSAEHQVALSAIFQTSNHVFDTADGKQKVDLHELRVALQALGFSEEDENAIAHDADVWGGGGFAAKEDGEARLNSQEFVNVFARAHKPQMVRRRLESIGKSLRADAKMKQEAAFDEAFGLAVSAPSAVGGRGSGYSEARRAERAALSESVDELEQEAFPYAVVATSLRLRQLVNNYEPTALARESAKLEAAKAKEEERRERRRRGALARATTTSRNLTLARSQSPGGSSPMARSRSMGSLRSLGSTARRVAVGVSLARESEHVQHLQRVRVLSAST